MSGSRPLPRLLSRLLLAPLAAAALLAAPRAAPAQTAAPAAAVDAKLGLDTAGFDRSVPPADDLFEHVNGGWMERTEIPADRAMWGAYFALRERTRKDVRATIREAARSEPAPGTPARKVGDLYASYVDTARRNRLGLEPAREELERVAAVEDRGELLGLLARFQRLPAEAPLSVSVGADLERPERTAVYLRQDGLGLPIRQHYTEERYAEQRTAYREHLARVFGLAGLPDTARSAAGVLELETRLAEAQWPYERRRDATQGNARLSWAELAEEAPGVDWRAFAEAAGLAAADTVLVAEPSYVTALAEALAERPLERWKRYFRWRILEAYSPYLSRPFVEADFDFYRAELEGVEAQSPLWRRAVETTNQSLGQLVGRLYVDAHLAEGTKRDMERMVEELRTAFHREIEELPWMSDSTKAAAHRKLRAMRSQVAYPDEGHWRDYSDLEIRPGELVGNLERVAAFDYRDALDRIGEPVDPHRWKPLPQEVNGYIESRRNLIVITSGILQPPFYQPDADPAVNYGGIGAVIGHEISHAFDSEGRKFDHAGRLRDWWTAADARRFEERGQALVEQFDRFSPLEGDSVDGSLTLPENIADVAGLASAHRAYRLHLDGEEAPVIAGFTGDQRFFMSWAQVWRMKIRDAALRQMLERDPHSPPRYRVNGIVPHLDAFHAAFDVEEGDGLWRPPEERVEIW